jgi:DNA gyrase subunit A
MAYKLKVYRLPAGQPASRGKHVRNLLPLEQDETISTAMPLPEDEDAWGEMYAMFATSSGNVRRNSLSDFTNVKANGKIAMKLDEGDRLVSVRVAEGEQDVLLASLQGKAVRFPVSDVRVFKGRDSTGVRGVRLGGDDQVISMSILHHVEVTTEEREAYLRYATQKRRQASGEGNGTGNGEEAGLTPESAANGEISAARLRELEAQEELLLTVGDDGFGKLTPAYEYRITSRGTQGITAMDLARGKGSAQMIAAFPVDPNDQVMVVTDGGQLIRCPVQGIRIAGRNTRGVRLLRVADGERVVSVAHLGEQDIEQAAEAADAQDAGSQTHGADGPSAPDDGGPPADDPGGDTPGGAGGVEDASSDPETDS